MSTFLSALQIIMDYGNKFVDVILMLDILFRIFSYKRRFTNTRLVFLLSTLAGTGFILLIDKTMELNFQTYLSLYFLVGLLFSLVFLNGKIYLKGITLLAYVSCLILVRFITTGTRILLLDGAELSGNLLILSDILQQLSAQLMLFLITRFIVHHAVKTRFKLPTYYWIIMLAILAVNFIMIVPFRDSGSSDSTLNLLQMLYSLVIVMLLYYLFSKIIREYEEKYKYKLLAQQLDMQKKYLEETTQSYNNLRQMRHELKNHVFCMNLMLKQKRYDELETYFSKLYRSEYTVDMIESGNNIVNAILNQKAAYARSKQIDVQVRAALPQQMGVEESQLCAVISNLFDNAIEACEEIADPQIDLEVKVVKNYIAVVCTNTVDHDVLRANPNLLTTKRDRNNHGIGLQVVRSIVDQYDGMLHFEVVDSKFVASAMLGTRFGQELDIA
ncbi:sensor histidine kinase [Candidatus Soleaferrea massiliensis]|uniref:sensor histidine kinase n=1 Tax=Candidatus Soleaferrea massiliensis TaxID=1470354 RepID=UPI00058E4097|nr:sensor histidine kinase [Candidatus Soleaferrea massiliensis]